MPGSSRPTVPALKCIGVFTASAGDGLGRAVALENADAELLEPDAPRLGLHALGAGKHVAHRIEVVVVGDARVAGEERVGAEEDRGVDAVGELRHRPVVQRRRIQKRADAGEQRQQQAAGQPEAVEHGQRVEDDVLRADVDDRRQLMTVREQVAVAQHDALRRAFRARREEHDRRIVGAFGRCRGRLASDDRTSARSRRAGANLAAHVLEIERSWPATRAPRPAPRASPSRRTVAR